MKKIINLVCGTLTALLITSCSNGSTSYQITFYDDAQNVLETTQVSQGKTPIYSKGIPTKESTESTIYTFNRWIPEIKAATADASYVASFNAELRKYTVSFDSDGGTEIAPVTVEWGKKISGIPTPSKADSGQHSYTFQYWYDTTGSADVPFKTSTEIKRNYSLKAKWVEGVKTFTVSFNTHGGSFVPTQTIAYGGYATKPEDPTHDSSLSSNYTFDGWYLSSDYSGNKFDFSTAISSNITLHAKWKETAREYTVTFYSGEEVYDAKKVNYNCKVTAPAVNPTKDPDDVGEYTFNKWDFNFDTPIIGDIDIHAIYDINYVYYHYTSLGSTCTKYGCKDFYGTKTDVYSMTVPTKYYNIVEAGAATREMTDAIALKNPDDERLIALAHEFDDITGKCIYECGTLSITGSALDTSKLTRDDKYTCPLKCGNMYKYNGTASNIFASFSLDGLTEIRFYIANEDAKNGIALHNIGGWTDYEGLIYAGKEPQVVIVTRATGTNNWTVTTESKITLGAAGSGVAGTSYTVENASVLNEVLKTLSASESVYISDIVAEGTPSEQKEVLKDPYYVGKIDNKTYTLTNTGEKVTGLGNKYSYKCLYGDTTEASHFRQLFNDIDISSFKTVSFYIDLVSQGTGNYLTFLDDNGSDGSSSEAYGLHAGGGASVPGIVKAYNEGNGTWKVTGLGFKFRKVKDGSQTSEFTYHNRNTLKSLFAIGPENSWQLAAIYVSDVIVTK